MLPSVRDDNGSGPPLDPNPRVRQAVACEALLDVPALSDKGVAAWGCSWKDSPVPLNCSDEIILV